MKYSDYEVAFSLPRLNKYLTACKGNRSKALSLYRANVRLCQKFYGILNIFEVVLRNAINRHYQNYFIDKNWIKNQCEEGGMLVTAPQRLEILKTVALLNKQNKYSNDRLVASVTFGFWTYLFNRIPFRSGGMSLLKVFPNRTHGLAQRPIYNELQEIKNFRNRIAHHEAICFNSKGEIDLSYTKEKLELINKYVTFMGYEPSQLFFGTKSNPKNIFADILNKCSV